MTDRHAVVAAAAAVALLLLGAVLLWRRRRRGGRVDSPEAAAAAVEAALPGFETRGAVVGADGRAALVVGQDGRVATVTRAGGGLATQEVAWPSLRVGPGAVVVEPSGRHPREVAITGVDALDIRRLAPEGIDWRHR